MNLLHRAPVCTRVVAYWGYADLEVFDLASFDTSEVGIDLLCERIAPTCRNTPGTFFHIVAYWSYADLLVFDRKRPASPS